MHILYVGPLNYGGTCLQRMMAMKEIGIDIRGIDTTPPAPQRLKWLPVRVLNRFGYPIDWAKANPKILDYIQKYHVHILWVDKGLTITFKTLEAVKKKHRSCKIVSYSPDDMMNKRNQSKCYLKAARIYDLHVTTKSYNVAQLKALGAKDVLFIDNAYDPNTHHPHALTSDELIELGADVGFIGQFEKERYKMMLALANEGIKITVRGPDWERYINRHPNLLIKPGWILNDRYAKGICAAKINLCFLRKVNRDLQTTRSIEIPACGGFMLAERTNEHLALFEEGKEAEFFANEQELIEKAKYYLSHDDKRKAIAARGRERCLKSKYSNYERLRAVFDYLSSDIKLLQ